MIKLIVNSGLSILEVGRRYALLKPMGTKCAQSHRQTSRYTCSNYYPSVHNNIRNCAKIRNL